MSNALRLIKNESFHYDSETFVKLKHHLDFISSRFSVLNYRDIDNAIKKFEDIFKKLDAIISEIKLNSTNWHEIETETVLYQLNGIMNVFSRAIKNFIDKLKELHREMVQKRSDNYNFRNKFEVIYKIQKMFNEHKEFAFWYLPFTAPNFIKICDMLHRNLFLILNPNPVTIDYLREFNPRLEYDIEHGYIHEYIERMLNHISKAKSQNEIHFIQNDFDDFYTLSLLPLIFNFSLQKASAHLEPETLKLKTLLEKLSDLCEGVSGKLKKPGL